MAKAFIRPAKFDDVNYLNQHICEADRLELKHLTNLSPFKTIYRGYKAGASVIDLDGRAVVMFGCGGKKGDIGSPWLLCTDEVTKVIPVFRHAKEIVRGYAKDHTYLMNYAWSKNAKHLRLIEWIGFNFTGATYISNNETFLWFELNKAITGEN